MIQCEELSGRLPELPADEAAWGEAERAHLAACAECRAEWRLVRAARRLGARAPAVDATLVAAAVRGRLAGHRRDARIIRRWAGAAAVAAAAAVVLVAWPHGTAPVSPPAAVEAGPVFLPELDSLSTSELRTVLESVDRPIGSLQTLDAQGMGDLSDDELAGVLQAMEG
jgi:hypothetical protein